MKVFAAHVKLNDHLNPLGQDIGIPGIHSALGLAHHATFATLSCLYIFIFRHIHIHAPRNVGYL